MNFLVLLLVLLAERFSGLRRRVQRDGWWQDLRRRHETPGRPWWSLAWLVGLPLLLVALLLPVLEPMFHGWLALPVHLVLLLYSLGRDDAWPGLMPFREAWTRGDAEAAGQIARRDLAIEAEDAASLFGQLQHRLLLEAFQGLFAVIFWYVLLGPLAALAYRLLRLAEAQVETPGLRERAAQLAHAFDWLPVRALIASFALVGHFTRVRQVLRRSLWQWEQPASQLLAEAGELALVPQAELSGPAGVARLDELRALLVRCVILWYGVFALWTLLD